MLFSPIQTDVLGRCKVEIREASDMQEVFLMKTRDTESCPDRSIEFSTILRESKVCMQRGIPVHIAASALYIAFTESGGEIRSRKDYN